MHHFIVGITGASGSIYGKRLVERLLALGCGVYICMTPAGKLVAQEELSWDAASMEPGRLEPYLRELFGAGENLSCYDVGEIGASIASGSFGIDGMVISPCSMGTLSAVAHGASGNLLERAADVCLKERRPLIVVPREAPYNPIHLENMLALSRSGAVVMPASPAFYTRPQTIDELVDFFILRLLDQLGFREAPDARWKGTGREK